MTDRSTLWRASIATFLVTAAVICLIAAIVPALLHRHHPRPRPNCRINLRQIGLAMALYADLHDDRLPMDSQNPTLMGSMQLLTSVVTSAKIMHCSLDPRGDRTPPMKFDQLTLTNLSYSYVPNLKWQDSPDSIVACDRIYTTKKGGTWPTNGNHKGTGGNVLFLDGHTEFVRSLPSALKDQNGVEIVLSP